VRPLLLVATLAVMLGCTEQGVRLPSISVVNNSHGSIIYLAMERVTANRMDVIDSVRVAGSRDRLVAAGESKVIDIMGYRPGDDIRLFVYRLATPSAVNSPLRWFRRHSRLAAPPTRVPSARDRLTCTACGPHKRSNLPAPAFCGSLLVVNARSLRRN
jgi:hypothetical protein